MRFDSYRLEIIFFKFICLVYVWVSMVFLIDSFIWCVYFKVVGEMFRKVDILSVFFYSFKVWFVLFIEVLIDVFINCLGKFIVLFIL